MADRTKKFIGTERREAFDQFFSTMDAPGSNETEMVGSASRGDLLGASVSKFARGAIRDTLTNTTIHASTCFRSSVQPLARIAYYAPPGVFVGFSGGSRAHYPASSLLSVSINKLSVLLYFARIRLPYERKVQQHTKVSIGMVGIKGEWWMPRLEKAMKDAA